MLKPRQQHPHWSSKMCVTISTLESQYLGPNRLGWVRTETRTVSSRVLLKHAYVTMTTGPNIGWNWAFVREIQYVRGRIEEENDTLALSNPLASSPNHRSSIHHAMVLFSPVHENYHQCQHRDGLPSRIPGIRATQTTKTSQNEHSFPRKRKTHAQSAYKNPPKHQAAMNINIANCIIMARKDNTIRLSASVTNASLYFRSVKSINIKGWGKWTNRGKRRHAIRARQSMPISRARGPVWLGKRQEVGGESSYYCCKHRRHEGMHKYSTSLLFMEISGFDVLREKNRLYAPNARSNPFCSQVVSSKTILSKIRTDPCSLEINYK